MKLSIAAVALSVASVTAFTPSATFVRKTSSLKGFDLTGNDWKPDSEKMGSTDTGDYYPEGYNPEEEIAFSSGMMGSQAMMGGGDRGPQLPGMEHLGEDAVMMGGIEQSSEIPAGMEFVASSVPDGEVAFRIASSSPGATFAVDVKPVCMTFEDYFASFTPDSHKSLKVSPVTGRMDRRGGEPTVFEVFCEPGGQAGDFTGDLVINLPEDNSKICYKVTVTSF